MKKILILIILVILVPLSSNIFAFTGKGWHVAIIDSGIFNDDTRNANRIRFLACRAGEGVRGDGEVSSNDFHYKEAATCIKDNDKVPRKVFHWQPGNTKYYHYFGWDHASNVKLRILQY